MCDLCPEIATAQELGRSFIELVREKQLGALDDWLRAATQSATAELGSFVVGVQRDQAAVGNALALPWNNGPVEGQVNRLKLVKRQMYGRANFDLLRWRVLSNA